MRGKALHPKGCYECEEEVWEEVPCDDIPSNSTTVSTPLFSSTPIYKPTTPSPKPTTYKPSTAKPTKPYKTTTPYPVTTKPYPTTPSPEYTTPKDPYKKCYCECKLGCKEFCRKVVINEPDQQIVQVSKISVPVEKGRIESTHFLQRELIPKADKPDDYVPSYDDETDNDQYEASTPHPIPGPAIPPYDEEIAIDPNVYGVYRNKPNVPSPLVPVIEPIYHRPYATAEAGANNLHAFASYPPKIQKTSYYSPRNSDAYNFPIPFEHVFSKVTKTLLDPVESVQISLDASNRKIGHPNYSKCPSYHTPSYSSPTPVKDSQLETSLGNALNFDDSFDSLIKEFISNNPSNEAVYQKHPKPFYSVSYSR